MGWQKGGWYEKIFFLPFFTQSGPTFWSQKAQIRNSLNSILVKKDRNYIIINSVTLKLTNSSLSNSCQHLANADAIADVKSKIIISHWYVFANMIYSAT